jgi:hypothetical protein
MVALNAKETGFKGMVPTFGLPWADGQTFNKLACAEFGVTPESVIAASKALVDDGALVAIPRARGAVALYLPKDAPTSAGKTATPTTLSTVASLLGVKAAKRTRKADK